MPCRHGCCDTNREHWLSVSVSADATPTRRPATAQTNATEKQWERDMPAYKRLRSEGLQPQRIDGSGDLETRASDQAEIDLGTIIPDRSLRNEVAQEMAMRKVLGE